MSTQTSQPSRTALKSLEKGEFVVTSTRTQNPVVSPKLGHLYTGALAGGDGEAPTLPDWEVVQESNAALLEWASWEVRRTDREHRSNRQRQP